MTPPDPNISGIDIILTRKRGQLDNVKAVNEQTRLTRASFSRKAN